MLGDTPLEITEVGVVPLVEDGDIPLKALPLDVGVVMETIGVPPKPDRLMRLVLGEPPFGVAMGVNDCGDDAFGM